MMWGSVPQMATAPTRHNISIGPGSGTGTRSTANSCGARNTSASIKGAADWTAVPFAVRALSSAIASVEFDQCDTAEWRAGSVAQLERQAAEPEAVPRDAIHVGQVLDVQ